VGGAVNICIADRNQEEVNFLIEFLQRAGFVTLCVGKKVPLVRSLLNRSDIESVIMEVDSPDEICFSALLEFKRGKRQIPVVILSELENLDDKWIEYDWKPVAILQKPWKIFELLKVLGSPIARRKKTIGPASKEQQQLRGRGRLYEPRSR
jgi:DNA-binding response OmpR family regulator